MLSHFLSGVCLHVGVVVTCPSFAVTRAFRSSGVCGASPRGPRLNLGDVLDSLVSGLGFREFVLLRGDKGREDGKCDAMMGYICMVTGPPVIHLYCFTFQDRFLVGQALV